MSAILYFVAPQVDDPLWHSRHCTGLSDARNLLAGTGESAPVIGEGETAVLTRILEVRRHDGGTELIDPCSGQVVRAPQDWEIEAIGEQSYVLDRYRTPGPGELYLTFDDGPDPVFTPQILDVLSEEHVRASFFVLGSRISPASDMVQRIVREGHALGNHTITHLDFDESASSLDWLKQRAPVFNGTVDRIADYRNRLELVWTDRLMRSVSGYHTPAARIPGGDPEHELLAGLTMQQLGYTQIDFDTDTLDWQYPPGTEVPVPELDGNGHVVLMHDAGGDRTATIAMLRQLIRQAKAQGYRFMTVDSLLPASEQPVRDTPAAMEDHLLFLSIWSLTVFPEKLLYMLLWVMVVPWAFFTVLYLFLAIGKEVRERHSHGDTGPETLPTVSIIVPAYKETETLGATLSALHALDYPSISEVIVVDDGSQDDDPSDRTYNIALAYSRKWPQLRVYRKPNGGKASALNYGIIRSSGEIIVTMDGDTVLDRSAVSELVTGFEGPWDGVVAGNIKVSNRRNMLTWWQSLVYVNGIGIIRNAETVLKAVTVVPGACTAWRREALDGIGLFPANTLAEDADAAMACLAKGWHIKQATRAVAWTQAPQDMRNLSQQWLRWSYGVMQVLWKHHYMMFNLRYGLYLSYVALPYTALSVILPIVFLPLMYISLVISLVAGNWWSIVLFGGGVLLVRLVQTMVAIIILRESWRHLLAVVIDRPVYELLRPYLLYGSFMRWARGESYGWHKVERYATEPEPSMMQATVNTR